MGGVAAGNEPSGASDVPAGFVLVVVVRDPPSRVSPIGLSAEAIAPRQRGWFGHRRGGTQAERNSLFFLA